MHMTRMLRAGLFVGVLVMLLASGAAGMAASEGSQEAQAATLGQIVGQIEKRYDVPGFAAEFHQVSTVQALDIQDEATGKMYVRRPGKMRWEYLKPERQLIITNGKRLWVYRPADNQVMLGQAPSFFGDGKGAGFLADIRQLRKKFHIMPAQTDDPRYYAVKLKPLEESIDLAMVYLYVSKNGYVVERVVTLNAYGDETRIDLINSRFDAIPDDDLFSFTIPEGTDVLTMDQ